YEPSDQRKYQRGYDHGSVERARRLIADPYGERALSDGSVGWDVTQVVGHEDRNGEQPHRDGRPPHMRTDVAGLDVRGARSGNEAEKDEDGELSETGRCVRLRSARIENGGCKREHAETNELPACDPREQQTRNAREAEGDPRRERDR